MPFKLLCRTALISLLLLPLTGHAQLKSGRYFQAIAGEQAIVNTLWYQLGSEKQTIVATTAVRSRDYKYDEGTHITFYGDRTDTEGAPIAEAIVKIPEGASRLLLLFTKLPETNEDGLNYRVFAIEDDTQRFAFGSFQFINASTKDAGVNLGGNKFLLKKGELKNVVVKPPEQGDVLINIVAHNPKDMTWSPFYSNGWGHRDNLRTLVFIIDNPQGGVTTLRYRQFEPTN